MPPGANRQTSDGRGALPVAGAVGQFAAVGLVAVVLLGIVGVALLRSSATDDATTDAEQVTRLAGKGIVEPTLTDGVLTGESRALARVDRVVRGRVLDRSVVRVKIWTPGGRIVYSDEPRLIGARYGLGADQLKAIETGRVESDVSDLSRPENRFERGQGKLLEVYLPIRTPGGRPLLFESYQRFSSIASSSRDVWVALAPALIGALVLLWLVQLPLAWRLARRLQAGQQEREELLVRAIQASDVERRRVAGRLHDGAVQSLAGIAYSLSAADPKSASAEQIRQVVRELRGLLVDIYPPSLRTEGLQAALPDLLAPLAASGIDTRIDLPDSVQLPPDAEAVFFRVAQEALRNVQKHAEASRVDVRLELGGHHGSLEIEDDGRGFDAAAVSADGHFGLRLLEDLAADAGGTLRVDSAPGRGTRVAVELPLP